LQIRIHKEVEHRSEREWLNKKSQAAFKATCAT
jgi:hypothetical protein